MKRNFTKLEGRLLLLLLLLLGAMGAGAQSASISYPFAVGTTSACGGSTPEIHFYTYNSTTNTIANATGGTVSPCIPQLRIGGAVGGTQRFTSNLASVSFNPKDHKLYYLYTDLSNAIAPGGVRTYAWSWPLGTCTGTATNKTDTIRSFAADILGVVFDNNGNGYVIEFTNAFPTAPPTYKMLIRAIDFTTGVMGAADTLVMTGGAKLYQAGGGDVAMSPSGQMLIVADNKLFTPNYSAYTGTGANVTCTFIDSVQVPTGYFVGLTYAEGETIAAFSGGTCPFREIDPLTGDTSVIIKSGTVKSAVDMASVISSIGAAKNLVSVMPTGTANQYDVVYDIYVRNYGNWDITNLQVKDTLSAINGIGNVSNVSIAFAPGGNPAGLVLNPAFTGIPTLPTNVDLFNGTGTLPNFPVANNFVTVRVTCRLSNILNGVVYNNSATTTGVGYNAQPLRDVSTNGSMPDLNGNDKADETGESQPTPLLISVTAQTPPCTTLELVMYAQDFGTGATAATLPTAPSGRTTYTGTTTQPIAIDQFMLATNANAADNSRFISLADHTTGTGRMLLVNADAANKIFYSDTVNAVCGGQQYSISFYAAFVGNSSYQTICNGFGGFKYPRVRMRIRDLATALVITETPTTDITLTSWNRFGMKWVMPAGYTSVIFELVNEGQGGCGNDIAIDDITFGTCDADPVVTVTNPATGCIGGTSTFSVTVNDPAVVPGTKQYQWQVSPDGVTWTDILTATSAVYTISPLTAADISKYYRVLVAATGNIGSPNCRYTSPGYLLTAKALSTAPASISRNKSVLCPGETIILRANGGTLGTNAAYVWYAGACGGTSIGTGSTITVSPTVATTYYVRIEGDCGATTCASVAITFNCDIDADDDGIPDVTESGAVEPKLDDDFDGFQNWRDADYPGFADTNGDGVNDNFDSDKDGVPNHLDRDSDNDGIPDTVESGGADTDGDGRIDGYTDTDADGFSDNVDANLSGYLSSGSGLGLLDTDGDAVANLFDLDSDNDGIPDVLEVYGTDGNNNGMIDGFADADGDGLANALDGDADGNGTVENTAGPLLKTGAALSNGRASSYPAAKNMDADSKPNPYDLDSDGDGIVDVIEAQFADSNTNGIIDGTFNSRGWSSTISALGSLTLPNRESTGRANVFDIDSDDDGIPDHVEGMSTSGYLLPAGTDADGDGIDGNYDNISGFGGRGVTPFNMDGDAFPDYLDYDTDGDGLLDRVEGNDFNFNKAPDDDVIPSGIDTDGDGLDNKFDNDNASARGFSLYMGNGGSMSGPASPGSRAVVQRSLGMFADRDWRQVEYVLPLRFLSFTAALSGEHVRLNWRVLCSEPVAQYILERSTDRVNFYTVTTVTGSARVNEPDDFTTVNSLSGSPESTFYYRLKAVDKSGMSNYSTVAVVVRSRADQQQVEVQINPVTTDLKLRITVAGSVCARIYVYDARGQQVGHFTQSLVSGANLVDYPAPGPWADGHYYIKVLIDKEVLTTRFLLKR